MQKPVERVQAARLQLFLRWLPVAAWMLLIFVLSSQSNPSRVMPAGVKNEITQDMPRIYDNARGWRPLSINEVAHPLEYSVLAVLLLRALAQSPRQGFLNGGWRIYSGVLLICGVYAGLDEFHQLFVPRRTFQLQDLALDIAGAGLGLLLARIFTVLWRALAVQARKREM